MGQLRHLRILLWKNFLIRRRQPLLLCAELIWPLVLFAILAALRTRGLIRANSECHFNGRAMPSAGMLPFLQSVVCSTSNSCYGRTVTSEMPGNVPQYNAGINTVVNNLAAAYSQFTPDRRAQISELMQDLVQLQALSPLSLNGTSGGLVNMLVNTTQLQASLNSSGLPVSTNTVLQLIGVVTSPVVSGSPTGASQALLLTLVAQAMQGSASSSEITALRAVLCSPLMLQSSNGSATLTAASQSQLCNLTNSQLATLFQIIGANVASSGGGSDRAQLLSLYTNITELVVKLGPFMNNVTTLIQAAMAALPQAPSSASPNALMSTVAQFFCNQFTLSGISASETLSSFQSALLDLPAFGATPQGNANVTDGPPADQLTAYCSNIFNSIETSQSSTSALSLVWQQFKPFIRGKIPYAPDTPVTREIVKMANRTFADIANVATVASDWLGFSAVLRQLLTNTNVLSTLSQAAAICNSPIFSSSVWTGASCAALNYMTSGSSGASLTTANVVNTLNGIDASASQLIDMISCFDFQKFVPLSDENRLETYSAALAQQNRLWGAIYFDLDQMQVPKNSNGSVKPTYLYYKIRMDAGKVDWTSGWFDAVYRAGPRANSGSDLKYLQFGFAYLQDMMERAFIEYQVNSVVDDGVYLQQFPYPCYIIDNYARQLPSTLPMFIVLAWILAAAVTIKNIVYEREEQLKVLMRIMGLRNFTHWTASFISCFVVAIASAIIIIVILKVGRVLPRTDTVLLAVLLISYVIATILFAMLISQAFQRSNIAAVSGGVIFFVTYLPYIFVVTWGDYLPTAVVGIISLLSNVAISIAFQFIGQLEGAGTGAVWSNIAQPVEIGNSFTLLAALVMLWIDSIVYFLLLGYIDLVKPVEKDGCGKPWYYPVTAGFWCRLKRPEQSHVESAQSSRSSAMFESEPEPALPVSVHVDKLTKYYNKSKGIPPALRDVTLTFYDGQISGLLGHNGAGKSTFLSILTGFAAPTSGRVSIYGLDLALEPYAVRRQLGFCPQHNVLFDLLTVEEHILFYGRLKEVPESVLQAEVDRLVIATRLTKKRHTLSKNLSGGMKRKLSIAIAFIGDGNTSAPSSITPSAPLPQPARPAHKLIVLDEPTAGVDPHARRAIWDLLIHFKRDNTIVFTTHHMDEADILSDRIYIVSRGMLCTVGSTAFLKQTFGSGYYLSLVKSPSAIANQNAANDGASSSPPPFDAKLDPELAADGTNSQLVEGKDEGVPEPENADPQAKRLVEFLRRYTPRAVLVDNSPTELTFLLPSNAANGVAAGEKPPAQAGFIELFRSLDSALEQLGISSYGLSDTTLEEVFLRLATDAPSAMDDADVAKSRPARTVGALTDDALQSGLEGQTDDGRLPTPTTRLSFRRNASLTSSIIHKFKNGPKSDFKHTRLVDTSSLSGWSVNGGTPASSAIGGRQTNAVKKGDLPTIVMPNLKKATGCKLHLMQVQALFMKRWMHLKRSKLGWIAEILLPVIFILLALLASQILPSPSYSQNPLELQPWLLAPSVGANRNLRVVYSNDNYSYPLANRLEAALITDQVHHGTRCMNPSIHSISGYPCQPSVVPTFGQDLLFTSSMSTSQQYQATYGAVLSSPSILIALRNTAALNSTADARQLPTAVCTSTTRSFTSPVASPSWTVWLNTQLSTTDNVQQLTGHDVSMYLVQTNNQYEKLLYGAFSFGELNPNAFINNPQVSANVSASVLNSSRANLAYVPIYGTPSSSSLTSKMYFTDSGAVDLTVSPSNLSSYILGFGQQLSVGLNRMFTATYAGNNHKAWFNNKGYVASVAYMNALNNLRLRAYVQSSIDLAMMQLGSVADPVAIMQKVGLPTLNTTNFGITVVTHPLNRTAQQYAAVALSASQGSLAVAISLVFALAFLPASFLMYLISDRVSRSKLLQFLTGLPRPLYWAANFAWDYANYMFSAVLIIAIFGIFNQSAAAFAAPQTFGVLVAILFAYGFAAIPMLYPFSFFCTVPSTAFVFCSCASLFVGSVTTITTVMLESFSDPQLNSAGETLQKIFPIFPQYCLGRSAIEISLVSITNQVLSTAYGPSYPLKSAWEWDSAGRFVVYLLIEGFAYSLLTLIVEFRRDIARLLRRVFCICCKPPTLTGTFDENGVALDDDIDVARERSRVLNAETRSDPSNVYMSDRTDEGSVPSDSADVLRLINLTKVYRSAANFKGCACVPKNFVAVRGLSIGLKRAECFGLLGVNGAGKTTTFKMLTGDVPVTSGDARIGGWSILKDMNRVKAAIGYCPQFDALSGHLTAVEHLDFFSRLRGVAANDRAQMCAALIARLGLSNHAHRMVRTYSGGTKRKLSTAIALLGQPSVLYLDEPTSGMDPQARRFLWNVLESVIDELKCTVVLTTHSMDECEALCSRLAIMVNGSFRCLGSVTHLKNRFGGGYMIEIRMNHQAVIALLPAARRRLLTTVADDLRRVLPVTLKDSQNTILEFHLTSVRCGVADEDKGDSANAPTLAEVFEQLEAIRTRHNAFICDYSVCQTSLDHVFIHFAKMQAELHEEEEFDEDMAQASGSVDPSQQPVAFSELSNQPSAPPPTSEQAATAVENENEAYTPLPIPNAESNSYPNPTYTHDDLV